MLGWVCKAHSRVMLEAARPMSRTKWYDFRADLASAVRFAISSEYVLHAVSKPKEVSTYSFLRSPSIVLGTPITRVFTPCCRKYSASTAAFVLESSPPTTIRPSRLSFSAVAFTDANCLSVSIFVLPDPIRWKPPVFLNGLMASLVSSLYLQSTIPEGPSKKPYILENSLRPQRKSTNPMTTLCPPGAGPPLRTIPIFKGWPTEIASPR
mmetsp:Transcript_6796/g.10616  ORF Transcript_6796/g.10616 Transcript_6796/m.10616 type:complete len:209 (-) Transcript_6796:418-1044(-)